MPQIGFNILKVFAALPQCLKPFPAASPSVLFFVMLFVPPLIRHIAFWFFNESNFSGKNQKSKSRPNPRTKRHAKK